MTTTEDNMTTITLRTGRGVATANIQVEGRHERGRRLTHNRDAYFNYRTAGPDADGRWYETKSRGGGWRSARGQVDAANGSANGDHSECPHTKWSPPRPAILPVVINR